MSYDISYYYKKDYENPDKRELVKVSPFKAEGGTVPAELVDGVLVPASINECDMNITFNYTDFYLEHIDPEQGIRWIYGKTGAEVKERLEKAILKLGIQKNTSPFWQINTDYTFGQLFDKKKRFCEHENGFFFLSTVADRIIFICVKLYCNAFCIICLINNICPDVGGFILPIVKIIVFSLL